MDPKMDPKWTHTVTHINEDHPLSPSITESSTNKDTRGLAALAVRGSAAASVCSGLLHIAAPIQVENGCRAQRLDHSPPCLPSPPCHQPPWPTVSHETPKPKPVDLNEPPTSRSGNAFACALPSRKSGTFCTLVASCHVVARVRITLCHLRIVYAHRRFKVRWHGPSSAILSLMMISKFSMISSNVLGSCQQLPFDVLRHHLPHHKCAPPNASN